MAHSPPPPPKNPKSLRERIKGSFSLTPKTLKLVWDTSPAATFLLAFLTLVAAGVPVLVAYVGKLLIDAVVAGNTERALQMVMIELGVVAGQALLQRSLSLNRSLLGARLSLTINTLILE